MQLLSSLQLLLKTVYFKLITGELEDIALQLFFIFYLITPSEPNRDVEIDYLVMIFWICNCLNVTLKHDLACINSADLQKLRKCNNGFHDEINLFS